MPLRWSVDPPGPRRPQPMSEALVWTRIVLKRGGRCGFGPEVRNAVLTMTHTAPLAPSPALFQGPHSAVLLWSYSQYCSISHGEEIIPHWWDQVVIGTGRADRERMYKLRKKKPSENRYIHPSTADCSVWFSNPPTLQPYLTLVFFPCHCPCPPASGLCCLERR